MHLGLTITKAAAALGVTRTTLSELVNGKRVISPETAVRLSRVLAAAQRVWQKSKQVVSNSNGCKWPRKAEDLRDSGCFSMVGGGFERAKDFGVRCGLFGLAGFAPGAD